MRVMVLVKGDESYEAGRMPTSDELAEMGKFNEELVKAGVMLAGEGLARSAEGRRVQFEQWPGSGVPDNPGAWLMAVARRRGVDTIRRRVTFERKVEEIGRDLTDVENPMDEIEIEKTVQDDVLRLMFTACHPVLSPE